MIPMFFLYLVDGGNLVLKPRTLIDQVEHQGFVSISERTFE
jgi:hypothetical protein